jgi:hypothetical protein
MLISNVCGNYEKIRLFFKNKIATENESPGYPVEELGIR